MFSLTAISNILRSSYGYISVALASFALGAFLGWQHEHDKLIKYEASVQALAQEQERHNAEIIAKHNATKKEIHDDYKKRLDDLHKYYNDRVRDEKNSCPMSADTDPSNRANGSPSHSKFATTTDAEQCAAVTLQLLELQQWVRETR